MEIVQNSSKQVCRWIWMWDDNRGWILFAVQTRILSRSESLKFKCLNDALVSYKHSFSLKKTFIDGLESSALLVDYCDVFNQLFCLSFWRCSAVMLNFFKSVPMKKQSHLYLGLGELFLQYQDYSERHCINTVIPKVHLLRCSMETGCMQHIT